RENERLLKHLSRPHRIAPEVVDRLRTTIARWPTPPAVLVPTHGDWQPRNWLIDGGTVRVIDFGRAALRPAYTISLGWRSSSSSAILLSSPRSSPATAPIHASRARGTAIASARRSVRLSGRTRSATTRTNGRATG
ncbi:phosphotransferase family protein, partial [Kribbella sp.]|uniref:phosphotransferase family protein n=1 Tax=Kribbella sp. TaxID=1871183 RepID=UPI002D2A3684